MNSKCNFIEASIGALCGTNIPAAAQRKFAEQARKNEGSTASPKLRLLRMMMTSMLSLLKSVKGLQRKQLQAKLKRPRVSISPATDLVILNRAFPH